ncbi:MAG: helix-turn-helix domain-containing protein [Epsilonproteobacteria bacterium]|nr:helix-turn-helix domain-containing protein [Campylobacterota bacterium]
MFGQRLKTAMKDAGMTQQDLANKLGKSQSAIAGWAVNTRTPSPSDIVAMANILGVDANYLLMGGAKDESMPVMKAPMMNPKALDSNTIRVPKILGLAGCGASGLLEHLKMSSDSMDIDVDMLPMGVNKKKIASIRIVGDSMSPYLDENDWAIIQLRNGGDVIPVNGVYLITHGQNVHIKRCAFQADGSCLLISDNQIYPVEKALEGEWDIVGKVVALVKIGSPMLMRK